VQVRFLLYPSRTFWVPSPIGTLSHWLLKSDRVRKSPQLWLILVPPTQCNPLEWSLSDTKTVYTYTSGLTDLAPCGMVCPMRPLFKTDAAHRISLHIHTTPVWNLMYTAVPGQVGTKSIRQLPSFAVASVCAFTLLTLQWKTCKLGTCAKARKQVALLINIEIYLRTVCTWPRCLQHMHTQVVNTNLAFAAVPNKKC